MERRRAWALTQKVEVKRTNSHLAPILLTSYNPLLMPTFFPVMRPTGGWPSAACRALDTRISISILSCISPRSVIERGSKIKPQISHSSPPYSLPRTPLLLFPSQAKTNKTKPQTSQFHTRRFKIPNPQLPCGTHSGPSAVAGLSDSPSPSDKTVHSPISYLPSKRHGCDAVKESS